MPPSNTSRIAKNTLLLYFRQILIMLVSLYTVRVVLNVLGAEDYGIYNVVAGVVTMFGFLSTAMARASQRYFAFDLGKEDYEHLKTTFCVTFQIYILLATIIVVLAETIGLWFVLNKLVIPPERLTAAIWIYQAAVFSFFLGLITAPYMASIIAHENMNIYAYVSIVEAGLKLAIVYLLQVLDYDKLILYALLLTTVGFINTSIYRIYCKKHYRECKFQFVRDKALFKELMSYSGWNLFGASIDVIKNQIINILLNIYFGPVVNAARAIAINVSSAVARFSQNFSNALYPNIIKSYAAQKNEQTLKLVLRGCKITYFLMFIIVLPVISQINTILDIWIGNYPQYTATFTILSLIDITIETIIYSIAALVQATGKNKLYQSLVGGINFLNLPLSLICLKSGASPYSVMYIAIIITILACLIRLLIVRYLTNFPLLIFLKKVVLPITIVSMLSVLTSLLIPEFDTPFFTLCFMFCTMVVFTSCFMYFIGLDEEEKVMVRNYVKQKITKM